jgi:hypothetical protein
VTHDEELLIELPQGLAPALHETAELSRRQLGLPIDCSLIATGHQAEFWHPGILAKFILADVLARDRRGAAIHLVVDQDTNEFATLDVPVRRPDGALGVMRHALTQAKPEASVGEHEAFEPRPLPAGWTPASADVEHGASAIIETLKAHRRSASAAEQIARSLQNLMAPYARVPHVIYASELLQSEVGGFLLERIEANPWACATRYNEAVTAVPGSGNPLNVRDDRVEVPMWRIGPAGERLRAWDDDIARAREGVVKLRPRALLLTGLMRLALCDLFIHGLGGRQYDLATERWFRGWLHVDLQPMAAATATLTLPIGRALEAPVGLGAAIAARRRVWHDAEPGPSRPGPIKTELLRAVEAEARRSLARRAAFRRMHEGLAQLRVRASDELATLDMNVEAARRQYREAPIVNRRTWAFPLYPTSSLQALRERIEQEVRMSR